MLKTLRSAVSAVGRRLTPFGPRVTLGVRALVRDGDRVLLVRHTYVEGWHFPGGAVDPGESAEEAAVRELQEEAGVTVEGGLTLFGAYFHLSPAKSDHILFYVADRWAMPKGYPKPNLEIAETGLFPIDDLPKGTTRGTRLRLLEVMGAPRSVLWYPPKPGDGR